MPNEFPTSAPVQPANLGMDPGSAPQPAVQQTAAAQGVHSQMQAVPAQAAAQEQDGAPVQKGVVGKLKAYRERRQGMETFTLEETGVEVSFPKFRSHGVWMNALRMAKGSLQKAQVLYICKVATFDGERLTKADYEKYIPMEDSNDILARLFGGSDDDDDGDDVEGELQETA